MSPTIDFVASQVSFLYDVRFRCYGASNFPNFGIFTYFPHIKCLKLTSRHVDDIDDDDSNNVTSFDNKFCARPTAYG